MAETRGVGSLTTRTYGGTKKLKSARRRACERCGKQFYPPRRRGPPRAICFDPDCERAAEADKRTAINARARKRWRKKQERKERRDAANGRRKYRPGDGGAGGA